MDSRNPDLPHPVHPVIPSEKALPRDGKARPRHADAARPSPASRLPHYLDRITGSTGWTPGIRVYHFLSIP